MKHVKQNPHLIFDERVDFRSSTGKFAKPFRAAYALVYPARKRKPIILDLVWLGRRSNEATLTYVKDFLIEYYREVAREELVREEQQRETISARRVSVIPRTVKYKVKKTLSVVRDIDEKGFRQLTGFNFIFDKAVRVDYFSAEKIMAFLNAEVQKKLKSVIRPFSDGQHKLIIKFFGSEHYIRKFRPNNKNVVDVLGFSLSRTYFNTFEQASSYATNSTDTFKARLMGDSKSVGYLVRKMELVTDKNGKPILTDKGKKQYQRSEDETFMIYGFRIEFSKLIK